MLDAAVILVNYRSEALLCQALECLAGGAEDLPAEVIVVDNSPDMGLKHQLPDLPFPATVLPMDGNRGFAAAVNRGLAETARPVVILLNPDTRPGPGLLRGLIDVLARHPEAGVAAPVLVPFDAGEPLIPSATQRDPDLLSALVEYTAAGRLAGDWLRRRYYVAPDGSRDPVSCAAVQGACFAIARPWLERVGPFDEKRFFLYWEDTDFCRRVRQAGGQVLYCPQLRCPHRGGASTADGRQDTPSFWRAFHAYHRRYHGPVYCALLRGLLTAGIGTELALANLAGLLRKQNDPGHRRYRELLRTRWKQQVPRGPA